MTPETQQYFAAAVAQIAELDGDAIVAGVVKAVENHRLSEAAAHQRELDELSDAIASTPTKVAPRVVAVILPRATPARLAAATRHAHADALAVAS